MRACCVEMRGSSLKIVRLSDLGGKGRAPHRRYLVPATTKSVLPTSNTHSDPTFMWTGPLTLSPVRSLI